ncbi:MAG: hypothetical protein EZS28_021160 [Streblomastix strix]|uniref:Uncharacterized protein n=1 Tax=Streblomastix strix TaxID=222440 RepID=A0A5J4VM21_9EUKA|nr:MAG: hypothetical protein EZS28_021160 [Streblomastix strix]
MKCSLKEIVRYTPTNAHLKSELIENGDIAHITNNIKGNQKYVDGQRVAIEVDMATVPRRATFFVDDVEQTNFMIGVSEAVRF